METDEIKEMVGYYDSLLQTGKRELLEDKIAGSLDEAELAKGVKRLKEIKDTRDRFAGMLEPKETGMEKEAQKTAGEFYVKAEQTKGQIIYHLSKDPRSSYRASNIKKVLKDATKRFGQKKTLETLALGLGYSIARLQENGNCRITYLPG